MSFYRQSRRLKRSLLAIQFGISHVFGKIMGEVVGEKMKGIAQVRLPDGTISKAEVHWYEAHGIGRKEIKVKLLLGG